MQFWYVFKHRRSGRLVVSEQPTYDDEYQLIDVFEKRMSREEAEALAEEREQMHIYD